MAIKAKNMKIASPICSRCRARLSHLIARYKTDKSEYQNIELIKKISETKYFCRCKNCGHEWISTSKYFNTSAI